MSTSCENYGTPNGTACACPPGFGGSTCAQPACGGTIFQGSARSLANGSPFANLTSSGCSCEDGWTGTGCNVCQTAKACQSGFASVAGTSGSLTGASTGQNNTIVCNDVPRVYAAGEMSCDVQNPTLQSLFPGSSTLTVLRNLNSSFTPLPNTTAFGPSGSVYAQLFYEGVEQFFCAADTCAQDLGTGDGSANWNCQNLKCTCIPNTAFCGAVQLTNLTSIIDTLSGTLGISCDAPSADNNTANCAFKQDTIQQVFGSAGLSLSGCAFGECIAQNVIDTLSGNTTASNGASSGGSSLSGGVIAGLAVVGGLIGIALLLLSLGWLSQRRARKSTSGLRSSGGVIVEWTDISYFVPQPTSGFSLRRRRRAGLDHQKVVLDNVSGRVVPGEMMAIFGPSGAGKTTLIEILAQKHKSGEVLGSVSFPGTGSSQPRVGFAPQQDVLPPMLTVHEALLFAARLRLPEGVPDSEKQARVDDILDRLGISHIRNVRIGDGEKRGISGGEMRRVSIGLELVAKPDVLLLDEPTSGLDSVSAAKVAKVLHALAHDPENPTAVIASIHQPSSQLYHSFDQILLLSHGRALYSGPGGSAPAQHFSAQGVAYKEGYNVADYLLDIASDPPVGLFQLSNGTTKSEPPDVGTSGSSDEVEKGLVGGTVNVNGVVSQRKPKRRSWFAGTSYTATFLTQLEVLSGREWKILRRDKTLFFLHVAVASVLGVFCGGLYFNTGITISGFQSRVGCLFFLGALIAFSSLSALYNVVEIRPLFLRERSGAYYSPTAWLLSRFVFDVVPLRIIPTIIVSTITYWMAGLADDAAHFFKFLFILVLYTLAMTLFNFLLACLFRNGGIAILISALTALYQMTYAGFFVHLNDIPPVLRWLQWLCPLKYNLEALSVNEVGSGLMIEDSLEGVPVNVSASLIMQTLFGFGENNYYRDVLVLFAFIAGFGLGVVFVVWARVRERR
ncbi:ABC transporter [Dichomitus squalens LYAD-421 SS1]|uniref:ABC transporter n=1 Tax=Dichomitus squalens (strain LYAD-421) TaxID=732165 RepID=UPI0004415E59|nr:ABC transporter [Dichomitus squalens LYAD-421 SS1]EJF62714.1 ABC transporter [Dichomitus squalens LYAD-421 SS1]